MENSPITKAYSIDDDQVCDKLIEVLSKPSRRKRPTSNKYEEGKKILEQRFSLGGESK